MSKVVCNFRIDAVKLEQLRDIAKKNNIKYSTLINKKIDDFLANDDDIELLFEVKKIINELKLPFAYVKTEKGLKWARKERCRREKIAQKLEEVFKII